MEACGHLDEEYRIAGYGRGETVLAPPIHEGIGNALRRAYRPAARDVPSELARLLREIR